MSHANSGQLTSALGGIPGHTQQCPGIPGHARSIKVKPGHARSCRAYPYISGHALSYPDITGIFFDRSYTWSCLVRVHESQQLAGGHRGSYMVSTSGAISGRLFGSAARASASLFAGDMLGMKSAWKVRSVQERPSRGGKDLQHPCSILAASLQHPAASCSSLQHSSA